MSCYKEISSYYSEDTNKRSSVVKELGTGHYVVRLISDSGSAFSAAFDSLEDAENYAEDWVVS